jgi:hypothetical protein
MALFKGTIYKRLNDLNFEQWVNVYHVEALGPASALDAIESIANLEATVLTESSTIYRLSVQQGVGQPTSLRSVSIQGELTGEGVNLVPFFNTVRVILGDEFERTESKYLRGLIQEANVQGWNISGELRDWVQANYATPLLGILGLRGPNGEEILTATVQQAIQMRQVGWKRRARPGFKRGWVPV